MLKVYGYATTQANKGQKEQKDTFVHLVKLLVGHKPTILSIYFEKPTVAFITNPRSDVLFENSEVADVLIPCRRRCHNLFPR